MKFRYYLEENADYLPSMTILMKLECKRYIDANELVSMEKVKWQQFNGSGDTWQKHYAKFKEQNATSRYFI